MNHVFKHPNYYKKLRANRQQATGLEPSGNGRVGPEPTSVGREGPQVSSATRKNKIVDSSSQVGYSRNALIRSSRGINPEKASGPSSRTSARVAARDPVTFGIGDAPLMGPPNAGRRDPESNCIVKMSGGDVTRNSQGYGKSKPRVLSSQANKQQAEGNGRVGPKDSSDQASSGSRINKR